jgi:hypothetical protein
MDAGMGKIASPEYSIGTAVFEVEVANYFPYVSLYVFEKINWDQMNRKISSTKIVQRKSPVSHANS